MSTSAGGDSGEEDSEELALFRQQWRQELGIIPNPPPSHAEPEEEAAGLYWMGAAAERSGDMHAAIMYYRQAVQLVPDIEFRVSQREEEVDRSVIQEDIVLPRLVQTFHALSLDPVCQPERPTKEVHISALPVEVLRYILRWVVSAQLDMRALEQVARVCRGFYMLAREQHFWKMACKRLWGECSPNVYGGGWREMYICRPHLHYNGVYISRTSYVRPGERSLDGLYKAYHTVVYYRYLRFFADGSVMYQTSPLEPGSIVGKLCHKHSSEAVLLGCYTMQGSMVCVDVVSSRSYVQRGRSARAQVAVPNSCEQHFHMELELRSSRRQRFNQLHWRQYYCHSLHQVTKQVQVSHFNIDYRYTPFYFSRVKSFTTNSSGILN